MKGCLDLGDKAFLIAISQHLLVQEFSSMAEISFFIFIESKSVSLSPSPNLFLQPWVQYQRLLPERFFFVRCNYRVWGYLGHCNIHGIGISCKAFFFVSSLGKALVSSD